MNDLVHTAASGDAEMLTTKLTHRRNMDEYRHQIWTSETVPEGRPCLDSTSASSPPALTNITAGQVPRFNIQTMQHVDNGSHTHKKRDVEFVFSLLPYMESLPDEKFAEVKDKILKKVRKYCASPAPKSKKEILCYFALQSKAKGNTEDRC